MPASFDGNQVMAFVLFWIPWLLAVRELIRGIQHGEMVGYGRAQNMAARNVGRVTYKHHRVSFCLLFAFYVAIAVVVPAATAYLAIERGGVSKLFQWTPRPPPPENLPS